MSKFYIQTYGCQMNVADSDRMAALLQRGGGEPVDRPEDADVILLNTCSVREKPEVKVYSRLGELRKLKRQNPDIDCGLSVPETCAHTSELPWIASWSKKPAFGFSAPAGFV